MVTSGGWVLETRACKCGCGRTFRCLPASTGKYVSAQHDPNGQCLIFGKTPYGTLRKQWVEFYKDKIRQLEEAEKGL